MGYLWKQNAEMIHSEQTVFIGISGESTHVEGNQTGNQRVPVCIGVTEKRRQEVETKKCKTSVQLEY